MKSAEKPHEPHVLWIGSPLSCNAGERFSLRWVMPWLVLLYSLYSDRGCMPAGWVSQSGNLTGNLPIHTTGFWYRSHNFMPCQQPLWPVPNRAGWLGGARRDPRFLKMVFSVCHSCVVFLSLFPELSLSSFFEIVSQGVGDDFARVVKKANRKLSKQTPKTTQNKSK